MQHYCGYHAGNPRLCDHKCYTLAINILRPKNSAQLPPHNQQMCEVTITNIVKIKQLTTRPWIFNYLGAGGLSSQAAYL